ncbi:hypothetical protein K438DRAFT_1787370 [Mycena galopus ATCC 62051]|nr:hypothetical protein K438DRAFT_1787370 [Mycena galopus ATCC 62051]
MYEAEKLTKPVPERYIHSCIETKKGEIIILTFLPHLLKLLDDPGVTPFDGDTTYKGIEGKLNEWELTRFAKVVQRAVSVVRSYINGASADFFEFLFDELQRVKREVTGKPLPFKMFIPEGNLLVTNVDMDATQVTGLCRSVLTFNPEYSGIPKDTPPEQAAPKFTKVCWWHGRRPPSTEKQAEMSNTYGKHVAYGNALPALFALRAPLSPHTMELNIPDQRAFSHNWMVLNRSQVAAAINGPVLERDDFNHPQATQGCHWLCCLEVGFLLSSPVLFYIVFMARFSALFCAIVTAATFAATAAVQERDSALITFFTDINYLGEESTYSGTVPTGCIPLSPPFVSSVSSVQIAKGIRCTLWK